MLITSNYDNLGNAKNTVIHILNFRVAQYLLLFDIRYYLKNSLKEILEINFVLEKDPKILKNFKIKFKKRGVKVKCSLDKRTMILQFLPISPTKFCYLTVFLPICNNFLERNCLDKPAFNNISVINHSASMNNTVTNKTKLFPQLFALGPQIALKNRIAFYLDQPLPPN